MINTVKSQKLQGWAKRLESFIRSQADIPFRWGKNDCVTFTSQCIIEMTLKDPIEWGRDKYSNKEEALAVLKGHMGMGLYKTFDKIFTDMGFEESNYIGCGDIGFIQTDNIDPEAASMFDHLTMGVGVDNQGTVIVPGEKGLILTKQYLLVKAWIL